MRVPSRLVRLLPIRAVGQRFARLATGTVVRWPWLWRLFRRPLQALFDQAAPVWHRMVGPGHLAPLEAALDALGAVPARVLDLGTGTGAGALALAARFPQADVVGIDLSPGMIQRAR